MKEPRDPMKPGDLGDAPETRMPKLSKPAEKPRSADAVGEEDAQELVDLDESEVRSREKDKSKRIDPRKRR